MQERTNETMRLALYLAAGAYLIYLAVQMLTGDTSGMERTVSLIAGGIFLVAGAGVALYSIRGFIRSYKEGENHLEGPKIEEQETPSGEEEKTED